MTGCISHKEYNVSISFQTFCTEKGNPLHYKWFMAIGGKGQHVPNELQHCVLAE
jgi:hypothetical protein